MFELTPGFDPLNPHTRYPIAFKWPNGGRIRLGAFQHWHPDDYPARLANMIRDAHDDISADMVAPVRCAACARLPFATADVCTDAAHAHARVPSGAPARMHFWPTPVNHDVRAHTRPADPPLTVYPGEGFTLAHALGNLLWAQHRARAAALDRMAGRWRITTPRTLTGRFEDGYGMLHVTAVVRWLDAAGTNWLALELGRVPDGEEFPGVVFDEGDEDDDEDGSDESVEASSGDDGE
ncbi:uncharacterized protein BXZ73DRAFT_104113 [Epithele typhae]|uniref:uncharacterized protein n=1 Tax=Epithele typhae TaxID=378194 RepID=UPI0020085095|nr:uncharacterized protein BXZ73DRAFT_104113 [Epithele typhae]KAH9922293.1 hypothetical protein BXZ73DRAFT_104113 [Epithele typhae]